MPIKVLCEARERSTLTLKYVTYLSLGSLTESATGYHQHEARNHPWGRLPRRGRLCEKVFMWTFRAEQDRAGVAWISAIQCLQSTCSGLQLRQSLLQHRCQGKTKISHFGTLMFFHRIHFQVGTEGLRACSDVYPKCMFKFEELRRMLQRQGKNPGNNRHKL